MDLQSIINIKSSLTQLTVDLIYPKIPEDTFSSPKNTMNIITMENTVAGMPFQFNNYDVLLVSSNDNDAPCFETGNHVGNQRFRVLLGLYRQRYLQADMLGDEHECAYIIQEILMTVCAKCVPKGRFFEKGRDNRWQTLSPDIASTMIQNALKHEPVEDSFFERIPKRVCYSSGFELLYKVASKELPSQTDEFVDSPSLFDVVIKANGLEISQDRKHTGNNRLEVMFDIRRKEYKESSLEAKQEIAEQVVSSIIDDAAGRFLQVDERTGKYKVVSRTPAIACIRTAFDSHVGGEKKKFREAEVKKLVLRKHKKAILDRLEKRKGGKDILFALSAPPTRFNTLGRRNGIVSKAA